MKTALTFLVLAAITCLVLTYEYDLNYEWNRYKTDYYKTYNDPLVNALRKEIFRLTYDEINAHNDLYDANKVSYSRGTTESTDKTEAEIWRRRETGTDKPTDTAWIDYKAKFGKSYGAFEDNARQTIYNKKIKIKGTEINKFTDMTADEIQKSG